MIICVNVYQVKEGRMGGLLEELRASGIEEGLRAMKGNVCFNFSIALQDPDRIYLTDIWEDESAFQAHLESPDTAAWLKLKEQYVKDSQITRYDL